MKYLLAIDQGTSSTRAMLYESNGRLITSSQYPLTQYYPEPGWVEHCPEEIWSKTLAALKDVVSGVELKSIAACGITNQRETVLLWNKKTGECLYRAIVWQDRRTQDFCDSLHNEKELIQAKTGLLPDPYFSASKIQWLIKNIPEAARLAHSGELAIGTIDSFLIWRLTRGKAHVTDITNASRTLLFNIHERQWDRELLDLFHVNSQLLPEVLASDAFFGTIDESLPGAGIPITGVAGDQQAALIGQRCFSKGMIKATYGTGGFLMMNTGQEPVSFASHLLTTIAYQIKGQTAYALEGSLYHAGTTIKWLRDEMKLIQTAAETEQLAESLKDNAGVYLVPSFTGLGAPYWLSTPGAIIVGLSRKSNRAHIARAALESVAYLTREVISCMQDAVKTDLSVLRVDGGMAANHWFLQFLANQCQMIVQKPLDIESTAQGAAMLAALGCGLYSEPDDLESSWQCAKKFKPDEDYQQRELDFTGWKKAVALLL
ncbi:glycerol kinase [Legionella quinlivanii]|uniref:glycerol kinase n=1 Tax=Legionella quinlivanii TaxID=45073 RepID=A0A0W0XUV5_9GAMM|nr:glycerol kinase GlpK [Legionella quinlivanii]KTD48255.1 glycerol kinase [Legionella quinlivanii]SEF97598.1 glycerol kinase [Legionella quinlivanii DSM 21216]STY11297.1 glycerol kinase [Legionella quinlivanii]